MLYTSKIFVLLKSCLLRQCPSLSFNSNLKYSIKSFDRIDKFYVIVLNANRFRQTEFHINNKNQKSFIDASFGGAGVPGPRPGEPPAEIPPQIR